MRAVRCSAVALFLALAAASGCGSSDGAAPGAPDAGADAGDAGADAPDFSALDPAKCPEATAEDLHGFDPATPLVHSSSYEEDKAFYVLTLLDTSAGASAAITGDAALSTIAQSRAQALAAASSSCSGDPACLGAAAKWSDADITAAGDALVALPALAPLEAELRKSGTAALHATGTDAALLRAAWQDAAHGLNQGWDDYFASLAAADRDAALAPALAAPAGTPFYRPLLDVVLASLLASSRDEAVRYEPLADGENKAAIARIPGIDFAKYPFSVIVVPGLGPANLDSPLSPGGQVRADQAAARLAAGLAPLIALSGGHVHPDRTPYSEAMEMKKYLIETYSVPENAILVDPHARHTTTNLRNVARQLYRYGVPVDQPALVTTDIGQTIYIAAAADTAIFGKRCLDELGFKPWRGITNLDSLDDCWIPAAMSTQQGAGDLLDP